MRKLCQSLAAVVAISIVVASSAVHAQEYPNRTVRIIVAQPPGGGTDTIARLVADRLSKQLGQTFIVENRPGAGMNVGTEAAARADADGYTLLLGLNGNMAVNPSLFSNLRYDPIRDFTPVAMLANYPFLLVVNKDLPAKSVKDLIAMAKAKPGTINYASAGNGTGQQLAMELFKTLTGTNFTHVPYRGAQAAYVDVFSGQVPIFFDNISTAAAQVKGGMVRALAITTRERSKLLPNLPTVAESGVPTFEYHTWFGLWAPNKTPRPIIEKLNAEVRKALSDPAVIDIIVASAGEPATMPLADIEPFVKAEITKWGEVVKKAGIKIE
jgi:tripartite-type tricarboxylate transporter receptor subunit TctC